MVVFVVNCGSSSIKYQLINMDDESVMAKGLVERIGIDGSVMKYTPAGRESLKLGNGAIPDHKKGIQLVLEALTNPEYGVLKDMSQIDAVGHRVVHGGERFAESALITDEVLAGIEACSQMAPLHNPANLIGIRACMELMPETPQAVVFDTAFHQSMPKSAFLYGLPYSLYEKYGLRRYGFHGTSHRYVAAKTAELLGKDLKDCKIVTCHLGNGASVCAVDGGKSVDTSMGYTPLDGLLMGTRCGEIDPAVIPFLMEKEQMSAKQVDELLNRKSGVLGVTEFSSDFRDIEDAAVAGQERCKLALDIFAYRVKKYIGAYAAVMNGLDAVVFTAGLGENSAVVRSMICRNMEYLGLKFDEKANDCRGRLQEISAVDSRVKIFVIPTNEELVIARDTQRLCGK